VSTSPVNMILHGRPPLRQDANPFTVTGARDPRPVPSTWDSLTEDERASYEAEAADWPAALQASVERAGFTSPAEYLVTVGAQLDLGTYLDAVEAFTRRYVAFPSEHESVAVALWVAHAWLVERFETSPILAVTSAEMRSGKTRVLDLLALLVPQPFRVITPSEAVVYSVLAQRPRPTMLLDEADAIFGPRTAERYEGLRAILNSGNQKDTPVMRVKLEGRRREVDAFDVFGPKAVAGIGNLPTTVADRSIPIRMKRRMPDEPIAKFRRRTAQAEAARLVLDWSTVTVVPDVTVPDELNDRAADSWEPLLSIADAAGGSWPVRGRLAAITLSSEEDSTMSVGMRLLTDIQDVFGDEDHLTTAELLRRLHALEDAPWEEWYGSPLSGRGLAKLLGPYRVTPVLKRVKGTPSRGYFRSEFDDAWQRYVPLPGTVTSDTSVTPPPAPAPPVADVTDVTVPRAQPPLPLNGRSATVVCLSYAQHQNDHRQVDGRWVCTACQAVPA
jgi:hypothetical protein